MRRIDADALHEEISKWPESVMYKDWVQSAIANAPTIAHPPNAPLTLEELREMDGEPVWCRDCSRYGIISVDKKGVWEGVPFFSFRYKCIDFCWNVDDKNLTLYRCKPEEVVQVEHKGDITKLNGYELPAVDVVIGGSPC